MKKRILSGMRPTGKLHLGHLAGALDNWVRLQQDYDCFFMVADWHALMSEYADPSLLAQTSIDNAIDWLSAGIDPEKSTIFIQSQVPKHLELAMIFSCFTPLGWLERCPTYKEQLKQVKTRDLHTYGFLGYPVLQAADILLYRSHKVPVGEDQLPHLELTREIARRFNALYKKDIFPEPEGILTQAPRLLGLDARKMSKSYNNTIDLSDSADTIMKKVSSMITDPKRIRISDKGHPGVCNVFSYYSTFFKERKESVYNWCTNAEIGCTECKKRLAGGLIEKLRPLQEKRQEFFKDRAGIKSILQKGKEKASAFAEDTFRNAKEAMGL